MIIATFFFSVQIHWCKSTENPWTPRIGTHGRNVSRQLEIRGLSCYVACISVEPIMAVAKAHPREFVKPSVHPSQPHAPRWKFLRACVRVAARERAYVRVLQIARVQSLIDAADRLQINNAFVRSLARWRSPVCCLCTNGICRKIAECLPKTRTAFHNADVTGKYLATVPMRSGRLESKIWIYWHFHGCGKWRDIFATRPFRFYSASVLDPPRLQPRFQSARWIKKKELENGRS